MSIFQVVADYFGLFQMYKWLYQF